MAGLQPNYLHGDPTGPTDGVPPSWKVLALPATFGYLSNVHEPVRVSVAYMLDQLSGSLIECPPGI